MITTVQQHILQEQANISPASGHPAGALELSEQSAQFPALVVDVRLESIAGGRSVWQIALDRTEFRAGDAGELEAMARSGARLIVPVLRVDFASDGTIWHVVEKPLAEGTRIAARVLRSIAG